MSDFANLLALVLLADAIIMAAFTGWLAREKRREMAIWAGLGFLFGPIALLAVGLAPERTFRPALAPGRPDIGDKRNIVFTKNGRRYILGYTSEPDRFAIWDVRSKGEPLREFPRTDSGWTTALAEFFELEGR